MNKYLRTSFNHSEKAQTGPTVTLLRWSLQTTAPNPRAARCQAGPTADVRALARILLISKAGWAADTFMSVSSDDAVSSELVLGSDRQCAVLSVPETIRRYHDSLIRFLHQRLRVKEDAADIAQEAYIRMMQYEGSQKIQSPSSMLFRIAINVANDLRRYEYVHRVADQLSIDGVEIESHDPSAERQIAAYEDLDILYRAIEQLPPKRRQVFLLSRVERLTYPQIAAHCGISVKMVEKHISQALAFCMKKVGGSAGLTS